MQRTLYEMDIENDRRRAVLEGRQEGHQKGLQEELQEGLQKGRKEGRDEGVDEERLALVRDLIDSGQTKEQVESFLINIRKLSPQQAQKYYRLALKK